MGYWISNQMVHSYHCTMKRYPKFSLSLILLRMTLRSTIVVSHKLSEAMECRIKEVGVPAAVCWATLFHLSSLPMLWQCDTSSSPAGFDKTREQRRRHTHSLKLRQSASTFFHFTSRSGTNVMRYHSPPSIMECITCPTVQPVKGQWVQYEIWGCSFGTDTV